MVTAIVIAVVEIVSVQLEENKHVEVELQQIRAEKLRIIYSQRKKTDKNKVT